MRARVRLGLVPSARNSADSWHATWHRVFLSVPNGMEGAEDLTTESPLRPGYPWVYQSGYTPSRSNVLRRVLEIFHNRQRRHSSLEMLTPIEYELRHANIIARDQAS